MCSVVWLFFKIFALLAHDYSVPKCAILLAARSLPYIAIPRVSNFQHFMESSLHIFQKCCLDLNRLHFTIVNEMPGGSLDSF